MDQDTSRKFFPLTRGSAWFLEQHVMLNPHHWNSYQLLEVQQPAQPDFIQQAWLYLLNYHEGLRSRFIQDETGWKQYTAAPDKNEVIRKVDISHIPENEQMTVIEKTVAEAQGNLHLTEGPLQRMVYFHRGEQQPGLLFWVLHHILTDAFSDHILFQDLNKLYKQLIDGQEMSLKPPKTSLAMYTERLADWAYDDALRTELMNYWLRLPWHKCIGIPFDTPEGLKDNTRATAHYVQTSLSPAEFHTLQKQVLGGGTQMIDVLITTVVQALAQWNNSPVQCIGIQNHGRFMFKDLDLMHLVGFLSASSGFLFDLEGSPSSKEALQAIKQQYRAAPDHGNGLMTLHLLNKDPTIVAQLQAIPFDYTVEINYFGYALPSPAIPPLLKPASYHVGSTEGLDERLNRKGMIICSVSINQDGLHTQWQYSKSLHKEDTITHFAHTHLELMRKMIIDHMK